MKNVVTERTPSAAVRVVYVNFERACAHTRTSAHARTRGAPNFVFIVPGEIDNGRWFCFIRPPLFRRVFSYRRGACIIIKLPGWPRVVNRARTVHTRNGTDGLFSGETTVLWVRAHASDERARIRERTVVFGFRRKRRRTADGLNRVHGRHGNVFSVKKPTFGSPTS